MSKGFIKLNREAEVLLETDPDAFLLMCQIAFRAKWNKNKLDMRTTALGEALVGDFESCGLTEQRYRSVKRRLSDRKIATFAATNKGTIAKLLDNCFCDINLEDVNGQNNGQNNGQITTQQRPSNGQITTNQEGKKERKEEPSSAHVVKTKDLIGDGLFKLGIPKEEADKLFKTWGAEIVFLAYQHITADGYVIETTPIQAIKFACKSKPWEWKTNKPTPESHREKFMTHFEDGKFYNGYQCQLTPSGFIFFAGHTTDGAKFDDPHFSAQMSRVLKRFGIQHPTQIDFKNIKEA